MKLAISNIAWRDDEESQIASLMNEMDIRGVEIAPAKISSDPSSLSNEDIFKYKAFWEEKGIEIIGMQAILFGRPDLTLFESEHKRAESLQYLEKIINLGSLLKVKFVIFGSPRNRRRGSLFKREADVLAIPFFRSLGECAWKHCIKVCIEPNPPEYDCDYINNSEEAFQLVRAVDCEGFCLHLDTGALTLAKELPAVILRFGDSIEHFHVSHPYLSPVCDNVQICHREFAAALRKLDYSNWISVEMKQAFPQGSNVESVRRALAFVKQIYY